MKICIFDVAHGFCAYVVADNGNVMLIDCGHNDETGFHPADYLLAEKCSGIERFFPLNYDEDHLSGLPRLVQLEDRIPIGIVHRNPTVKPDQLRALKRQAGPLGPGTRALLAMLETYTEPVTDPPHFPNLEFKTFYNHYPDFTDTNNLSQILFLHYPDVCIVFPGDLEKAGWNKLLASRDFRAQLSEVNIFVASHHGRESGYVKEVFDWCQPDIIIISDEAKQYETQETNYGSHAKGIRWNNTETRKVLTTRNDGMITITALVPNGCWISASR